MRTPPEPAAPRPSPNSAPSWGKCNSASSAPATQGSCSNGAARQRGAGGHPRTRLQLGPLLTPHGPSLHPVLQLETQRGWWGDPQGCDPHRNSRGTNPAGCCSPPGSSVTPTLRQPPPCPQSRAAPSQTPLHRHYHRPWGSNTAGNPPPQNNPQGQKSVSPSLSHFSRERRSLGSRGGAEERRLWGSSGHTGVEGLLWGAHPAAPLGQRGPQTLGQGGGAERGGSSWGGGGVGCSPGRRGGLCRSSPWWQGWGQVGRGGGRGGRALRAGAPAGRVSDTHSLLGYI